MLFLPPPRQKNLNSNVAHNAAHNDRGASCQSSTTNKQWASKRVKTQRQRKWEHQASQEMKPWGCVATPTFVVNNSATTARSRIVLFHETLSKNSQIPINTLFGHPVHTLRGARRNRDQPFKFKSLSTGTHHELCEHKAPRALKHNVCNQVLRSWNTFI